MQYVCLGNENIFPFFNDDSCCIFLFCSILGYFQLLKQLGRVFEHWTLSFHSKTFEWQTCKQEEFPTIHDTLPFYVFIHRQPDYSFCLLVCTSRGSISHFCWKYSSYTVIVFCAYFPFFRAANQLVRHWYQTLQWLMEIIRTYLDYLCIDQLLCHSEKRKPTLLVLRLERLQVSFDLLYHCRCILNLLLFNCRN